jgi:dUTP pyrophosphatase
METLKYCKVREVKSPNRAHPEDAGIDFYVPTTIDVDTFNEKCKVTEDSPEYKLDDNGNITEITIHPGESVLLPSGIKVKVPSGYMLQFTNKSGVASKKHLIVGANVVDCGYEGECHINLHNVSTYNQIIYAGDKIVQGILIPVALNMPEEMKDERELYGETESARGSGGFGSSGNS